MSYIIYLPVFIFGVLIGNFTTSFLYRLPRNIQLSGFSGSSSQPPFCSMCNHILKFYEYLPILSWVSTRGRCNYCHKKVTVSYLFLEIICGIFAIICVSLYQDDIEVMILKFCICVIATLSATIYFKYKVLFSSITAVIVVNAALLRTLKDQSIFPWITILSFTGIFLIFCTQQIKEHKTIKIEAMHLILPTAILLAYKYLICIIVTMCLLYTAKLHLYSRLNLYSTGIAILLMLNFL